uniref:Uncharacterized protein n=1 Tax=Oryza brachyantha TaxID=4533 RepID=J3MAF7_ORYBR
MPIKGTSSLMIGHYLCNKEFRYLRTVSYCHRLPGLPFKAYHTSPSDLPAPGSCPTLFIVLPLSRVMCF